MPRTYKNVTKEIQTIGFEAKLRLAPFKSRIYDPNLGSATAHAGFVQSEKFVESQGGKQGDITIYGQDKWARRQRPFGLATRARRVRLRRQQPKQSNATTRRLASMNLAIRGIEANIDKEHADTFRRDVQPDLRADTAMRVSAKPKPRSDSAGFLRSERQLLANPPFNDSDWFRKDDDVRWQFGVPPKGNSNFAWVQPFIHHLAPHGMAGFVLANGSMSSNQSGEGKIRRLYKL